MTDENNEDWHWLRVGSNPVYCAVLEGAVVAVVYWSDEVAGEDEDGEPGQLDPGWFWFSRSSPGEHQALEFEGPGYDPDYADPPADLSKRWLDPVHDAALEVAAKAIGELIEKERRG